MTTKNQAAQQKNSSASAVSSVLQRQCDCGQHTGGGECGECQKKKVFVQRKSSDQSAAVSIPPIVQETLNSPGRAMDPSSLAFMESRFGHDFSNVRIHTDDKAADSARAIDALAYTVGRDVVFGAGQYSPQTYAGKKLIAHELAHVVQQGGISRSATATEIEPAGSAAEKEADSAADAVLNDQQPAISSGGLTLAAKKPEGAPDKIPPPGAFFVAKVGSTFAYTFNSQDIRSWSDPQLKIFGYYAKDVFGVDEATVQKFIDFLADEKQQKFGEQGKVKLVFFDIDPVGMAYKYPAVTILILLELHQAFTNWLKNNNLGNPQKVQAGYRDLEKGDVGSGKSAGGGGSKTGPGGKKGGGKKGDGGDFVDRPPDIVIKMGQYYKFLLKHFSQHDVFMKLGATTDDFITFAGNRPEAYNALPDLPDLNRAPSDPTPWQSFLNQWNAFMLALKESVQGGGQKGDKTKGGDAKGEKGGSKEGIRRFEAAAKLDVVGELPKYVEGSKIQFRATFDRTSDDNHLMNFHPFVRRADFDWKVYREIKNGSVPEVYDSGPFFTGGAREYELTLDKLGTYSVEVAISSPYFRNGVLHLYKSNILVVTESARAKEVFDSLLADPQNPQTPFERDENGRLKLKPGQVPFSISFELGLVDSEKKRLPDLVKQGKLTQAQADEYLKYLEEREKSLNEVKGEEESNKDYKRYVAEGTYLSRENSQSIRLQNIMFRKARRKSPIHLIYQLDFLDMTLDPSNPAHHPGEVDFKHYNYQNEQAEWLRAEKEAIAKMADHFHSHNDYPDGTVLLGVQRLEDGQLMQLPPIDTYNKGKTFRKVLGYVGMAAGLIALAATPFTGGASAPVGIVILQASALAIGVASVLLELNERYEKERTIKADRRLLMDIVTLVASVMGAGGFSNALRTATQAGKLLYVGSMVGLDIGTGVILTVSTRAEINRIEALYAVRIADEKDPEKKRQLEKERDSAIANVIGAAALNGAFVITSTATGAHQIVSGVGRKTGTQYRVRQEIVDLAANAKASPEAIRARLEDPKLTLEERSYLQESLLVPKDAVPTTKGEKTEQKIGKLGGMTDETRDMLREPKNTEMLNALTENPLAAKALKKCNTPCFPENVTPEQIAKLERLLKSIKKTGPYDEAALNEYLYKNRDNLDEALRQINSADTSKNLNAKLKFFSEGGKVKKLPAYDDPRLKTEIRDRAHDTGVERGRQQAQADGMKSSSFSNPFERSGRYGQGFDDIMVKGNDVYIVEYKGGGADLAPGQMSLDWVLGNIRRLATEGGESGRAWAETLAKALREGRLKGVAYSTPINEGTPQPTKTIGTWNYGAVNLNL